MSLEIYVTFGIRSTLMITLAEWQSYLVKAYVTDSWCLAHYFRKLPDLLQIFYSWWTKGKCYKFISRRMYNRGLWHFWEWLGIRYEFTMEMPQKSFRLTTNDQESWVIKNEAEYHWTHLYLFERAMNMSNYSIYLKPRVQPPICQETKLLPCTIVGKKFMSKFFLIFHKTAIFPQKRWNRKICYIAPNMYTNDLIYKCGWTVNYFFMTYRPTISSLHKFTLLNHVSPKEKR